MEFILQQIKSKPCRKMDGIGKYAEVTQPQKDKHRVMDSQVFSGKLHVFQ